MKRYSIVLLIVAAVLLMSVGAQALPPTFPKPDGCQTFKLQQGWLGSGYPAWYICTDTNDIRWATTQRITLAPKLVRGFYGTGVGALFWVTNPKQSQGPVFEAAPGQAQYSGIWRVRLVTWTDLCARVPLCSIGQIIQLRNQGKLDWVESEVRVDYPIIATGALPTPPIGNPPMSYVIPQAKALNIKYKTVTLPTWNVYCQDFITRKVSVQRIIIPDAGEQQLAFLIGANYAPQLQGWGANAFTLGGTMRLWYMLDPKPVNQWMVEEACPTAFSVCNRNYVYSPVQNFTVLQRNMPVHSVVNNPIVLQQFLMNNCLQLRGEGHFLNAPVIPSNFY